VSVLLEAAIQSMSRRQHRDRAAFCSRASALVLRIGASLDDGGASLSTWWLPLPVYFGGTVTGHVG
jgi:hypothetical protein